jgi:hypothetical protein
MSGGLKLAITLVVMCLTTVTAHAQADIEGPDCTGTVVRFQHSVTVNPHDNETCSPKWITDLNSSFAKQILNKCPFGTHCHIEGVYSNHGIERITKVQRVH